MIRIYAINNIFNADVSQITDNSATGNWQSVLALIFSMSRESLKTLPFIGSLNVQSADFSTISLATLECCFQIATNDDFFPFFGTTE